MNETIHVKCTRKGKTLRWDDGKDETGEAESKDGRRIGPEGGKEVASGMQVLVKYIGSNSFFDLYVLIYFGMYWYT